MLNETPEPPNLAAIAEFYMLVENQMKKKSARPTAALKKTGMTADVTFAHLTLHIVLCNLSA